MIARKHNFELHLSFQDPANRVQIADVKDETTKGICPFAVKSSVGVRGGGGVSTTVSGV